jgi:hypothetical protein
MDSSKIHELWSFIYENYINLIHRFTLKTKPNLALKTQEITMHSGLVKFTIFWSSVLPGAHSYSGMHYIICSCLTTPSQGYFNWSLFTKTSSINMKNSFMYDGAKFWNSTPKEIRESKSLSSFRNKIAAHIYE